MCGQTVVIIEDERPMRRILRGILEGEKFKVVEADSAEAGIIEVGTRKPSLVILDLGLPDRHGLDVIHDLRTWTQVPIVVLSAHGEEEDKVMALDAGADDYVQKPFGTSELMARVRAALRHSAEDGYRVPAFVLGDIHVDLAQRRVWKNDEEVHLTPLAYRLLTVLIQNAGKIVTHEQLLLKVWGPHSIENIHYLRVYIGQLRMKLETDPDNPDYFLTVVGAGYRLAVPKEA